jgi:AcrR family transcriptional regulator
MSPKPDASAERKQQIYAAALACFNRKGYYQTTMDDIVVESGLSKGALYWYFDSKKALFISLLGDFMSPMGQDLEAIAADQAMSATQKMKAMLAYFRTQADGMIEFFGLVIEAWAQTHFDDDVQQLTRDLYKPYQALMERILAEGVARGEFRQVDAAATSAVILTLFDGLTLALGAGMIDQDPDTLMETAGSLVLRGLGVEA